tara:strand:+ start:15366 stop:16160 length:795 start_codon:yes stop_codon:yes gene_type:complete
MADSASLIVRIRRKVLDYGDGNANTQTYDNNWYTDAIIDALSRLNTDINATYTVTTLPIQYEWAVVLLGAITMAGIRAVEHHTTPTSTSNIAGAVRRVEVQGLETEYFDADLPSPDSWLRLVEDLWAQYKEWLDSERPATNVLPLISVSSVMREDLRNNRGLKNYALDTGLTAPSLTLTVVDASNRTFSWSPVYSTQFSSYFIQRKEQNTEWVSTSTIKTISDNHTVEYKATGALSSGTYIYRLGISNRNSIKTYSSEVTLVVS